MPNGDAPEYIDRNPKANVLQIVGATEGLRYLAAQTPPIAHGDLKGANVLVTSDERACICDFGLSRFIVNLKTAEVTCFGTARWMAPEQLSADTMIVSLSADIFSWGMLALELMTETLPWSTQVQNDCSAIAKVLNGTRPNRPNHH
ncbi:unnamed protein product, partial [Rhizoctonia solani]